MSAGRKLTVRRVLLARRRVDPWILVGSMVGLGLLLSIGKVGFAFFAACGIYLALVRPRSWRAAPPAFTISILAWASWQIGLSLLRGEPIAGNRTLSYAGIELAVAFLPMGLALVRDPIGALANGARIGLACLAVVAPVAFLAGEDRVGLGGNEAIFAFVIGVVALAARLTVRDPKRWLPNARWWSYLVVVPVLLSGTRAAFVIVLLVMAADAISLARGRRPIWLRGARGILGATILTLSLGITAALIVENRISAGIDEYQTFERTGVAAGSVDTRIVMWSAGWQVLREHPLLGVGGTHRMEAAGQKAGRNGFMVTYYQHLHNVFLDEALSSGLISVAFQIATFAAFLTTFWRAPSRPRLQSTAVLLVVFFAIFGSFHGVLLNEWTLISLFGVMSCMLTDARRKALRR
ncbi:O-antigen ligase family protein [Aureimonas jatrophae]|uniref:O-antigen ligase n=1 Tax=Aureimonas jatrophae TaxID=1166073 RepID=A0A1H0GPU3_9HYPH|nr:O-antigen ligase family protein [Aureimonas jatrophae]MBB3949691.1 O-antigen ligase [Aureimonas jatrophae]SDO08874.1 O-antigen ligase [Aureimonas jatrophae]